MNNADRRLISLYQRYQKTCLLISAWKARRMNYRKGTDVSRRCTKVISDAYVRLSELHSAIRHEVCDATIPMRTLLLVGSEYLEMDIKELRTLMATLRQLP